MPQSFSAIYLHAMFSTKERLPLLRSAKLRQALHAYLGATSRQLGCVPLQVGGTEDHVHVLAQLGREVSAAEWIKEIKRVSSRWVKAQDAALRDFRWQDGYAAFSVSVSNCDAVRAYIADQERHHARLDFRRELVTLLERYDVKWDERYLWD